MRHPLAAALVLPMVLPVLATAGPPRYDLEPGQVIRYETEKLSELPQLAHESKGEWTLWVLDGEAGGPWRILARARNKQTSIRNGERRELWDKVWYARWTLHGDGRSELDPAAGSAVDPDVLFPRLPADEAEMAGGWTWSSPRFFATYAARITPAPASDETRFAVTGEKLTDAIYLVERSADVVFDEEAGLVRSIERRSAKTWGTERKERGFARLLSVARVPAETLAALDAETSRYFEAVRTYDELTEAARADLAALDEKLEGAREVLIGVRRELSDPGLLAQLDEMIEIHGPRTNYHRDRATRRANLLGKPAPDWTLPNLDGVTHALADQRGKVVILDFWYRGCTWCVRSMPQLKAIAEEFADEPVVLFGMNTDKNLDDARFVVDAMQLNYDSLQAPDVPKAYHVRAFPTLVIIDQQGVVREVHVGYTADLAETLRTEIRHLLEEGSAG